jgi:hypothetical protein
MTKSKTKVGKIIAKKENLKPWELALIKRNGSRFLPPKSSLNNTRTTL